MESFRRYFTKPRDTIETNETPSDSKIEEKFLSSSRNSIILFGSFIISLLIFGLTRLSGLVFVACITRYNIGRKQASLPFTLAYTVMNVSGPFVGYLGRRFGSEIITLYGCVISAIGIGACFFASSITVVTIFWGGIYGLGLGMGTLLIPHILHLNFAKHLDKANGIFYGGGCVGAFILPVIAEASLEKYGIDGTFLILCGLLLNCVPAAILLLNVKHKKKTLMSSVYKYANQSTAKSDVNKFQDAELKKFHETREEIQESSNESSRVLHSKLPKREEQNDEALDSSLAFDQNSETIETQRVQTNNLSKVQKEILSIRELLEVFLDPTFYLITITQNFFAFILTTTLTIIVDFSRDGGLTPKEELYILMGFAVADTIGRFSLGIITDSGYISKPNFCVICYGIVGFTMLSFTWLNGFITIMISMCVYGLFSSGLITVGNGICSVYIESDKLIMVFSCRSVLYPLLGLSQPFMIDYFRDHLKSYSGLLYCLAGMSFSCAALSLLIPPAARFRENRKRSRKITNSDCHIKD